MAEIIINPDRVYLVPEVAELLGLHPNTVRALCAAGEIRGRKVRHAWHMLGANLQAFIGEADEAAANRHSQRIADARRIQPPPPGRRTTQHPPTPDHARRAGDAPDA